MNESIVPPETKETAKEEPFIDLDSIDPRQRCNEGAWVTLKIGTVPVGLEVKMRGRFSDVYEKISRDTVRAAHQDFKRTKEFNLPDPVDAEEKKLAVVIACGIAWRGKNAKVAFSPDAFRALLQKQPQFIEQLDRAIGEDERFLLP